MAVDLNGLDYGKDAGMQRPKLCVYEFYQGTGNHTETFPIKMRELLFSNDSTSANCTIQLIGPANLNISIILLPNEVVDERFPEFTSVVITATGDWRFYPRTHLIP